MDKNFLEAGCPLISRALINPWRLVSLVAGLALLILGSVLLPSADWDIAVCFVMGIPAYILAPWSFRQIWYFRWKWWPLAALAFWFSVDVTYTAYWWCRDFQPLQEFRPANFFYCTPIFWIAGFVWNMDIREWRLRVKKPLSNCGWAFERRAFIGFRLVLVVFCIVLISITVAFLAGLQRFFVGDYWYHVSLKCPVPRWIDASRVALDKRSELWRGIS